MTTHRLPSRLVALAATATTLTFSTSCGSAESMQATSTATATTTSPSAATSTAVTTAGTATAGTAMSSAALPRETVDYGQLLLDAYVKRNTTLVSRLASPAAASSLKRVRQPNRLMRTACEDDMCSWSDETGRRLTMTFDVRRVSRGAERGVTAVKVS